MIYKCNLNPYLQCGYAVPLIPLDIAAYLATAGELVLPVLLVLGLFGLNFVAAISYPDISAAGEKDHWIWGTMLLVLVVCGVGKLSLDYWVRDKNAIRNGK